MISFYSDDLWCGMGYLIRYADIIYILYFAIEPSIRGRGYGKMAIKSILEKYSGSRVIVALEEWNDISSNIEQRIIRHRFYLKCGFIDLPCKLVENNVIYAVMGNNGEISSDEYKALIESYLGCFWKHFIKMKLLNCTE